MLIAVPAFVEVQTAGNRTSLGWRTGRSREEPEVERNIDGAEAAEGTSSELAEEEEGERSSDGMALEWEGMVNSCKTCSRKTVAVAEEMRYYIAKTAAGDIPSE